MGCKYKKHNYSKIDIDFDNNGNGLSMKDIGKSW